MNKYLRIILLILTILVSIISTYLLYILLIQIAFINLINRSEYLFLLIIYLISLFSILPSVIFHIRTLNKSNYPKKTELLDDDFEINRPSISLLIRSGHILMGISIAAFGSCIYYLTLNESFNLIRTSSLLSLIFLGFIIIRDGITPNK